VRRGTCPRAGGRYRRVREGASLDVEFTPEYVCIIHYALCILDFVYNTLVLMCKTHYTCVQYIMHVIHNSVYV